MAWLCFNDAFLSVVNHRDDKNMLVVRARRREHLTNVFGKDAQITVTPERDYKYRVIAERKKVAEIVDIAPVIRSPHRRGQGTISAL